MTWATFFKSRPFKYGSIFGGIGFAAGAGGSAAMALSIASQCSSAVAYFLSVMNKNITISELSTVVHYHQYNVSLKLEDLDVDLPTDWETLINRANELPAYCFAAPFAIGLCIAATASLALASTVAVAVHISDSGGTTEAPQDHQLETIADGVETQSLLDSY